MSQNKVKVGDQVRFLNAIGGGRVARVAGDTAWVEDEDGFEIPTLVRECVVVEAGDTFMPAYKPPTFDKKPIVVEGKPQPIVHQEEALATPASEERIIPKPHTFLPAQGEVNVYLAYLPIDEKRLGQTNYELYLVNDSDYTLYYIYSTRIHNGWQLRSHGTIEPNSEFFVEEFAAPEINERENINIQIIAIAENPGIYKGTYGIEKHIDGRKFFKLHTFQSNDFFDDNAWVEPLVENGVPTTQPIKPDARAIQEAMHEKMKVAQQSGRKAPTSPSIKPNEPLVVDLHIEALLDDITGMGNAEILRYQLDKFNAVMQENIKYRERKIIFIHGKGEGVLRNKIEGELKYRYKGFRYQDASFREYSYGATQVTIGELPKK